MKENIYDNPHFFAKYGEMLRSKEGLAGAGEWPTVKQLLPDLQGKRVLDLGCGYGWHCFYAAEQGAEQVLGIDLSERMLEVAKAKNLYANVAFRQAGIEDFAYPAESYDLVICSLALHYIDDLRPVFAHVSHTLTDGGHFVFTIEHPIFTAEGTQDWYYDPEGRQLHWPVDHYFREGRRESRFLGETVVKYHHTLTTILQGLLQNGFALRAVVEPQPTAKMLADIPGMADELRRPMMLSVAAVKQNTIQKTSTL